MQTYCAVLGAVVLAGGIRVALAPTDRPTLRMAAVNRPADLFVPGEMTRIAEGRMSAEERPLLVEKLHRLQDWFLEGSRREARAGARIVAWPEQNLLVLAEDEPAFLEHAQRLAAAEHVYLAMGMGTVHTTAHPCEAASFENKLVLVDPSVSIVASYEKTHAVPGWEASIMRRGDRRLPVVATGDGDQGHPFADGGVQGRRERRVLLRPAASGLATGVDAWGRELAVADYFAPSDRTMVAQVPVGGVRTLYTRIGDLFAWLCVAGLVASVAIAVISRRATSGFGAR